MLSNNFLLDLAFILLSTKLLGLVTRKFQMPQVVGALLAGLILGPTVLGVVHETDFIGKMSELGVIVLMFTAGMETDLKELRKCGKASFIIAVVGVLVPLIGGFAVAMFFNGGGSISQVDQKVVLQNIFIGVILTATSVSITVETLQELGKLKSSTGTAILGAAIIDDILGIIVLTVITGAADPSVNIAFVLLKIGIFFVAAGVVGFAFYRFFNTYSKYYGETRRLPIMAFVFCLLLAFSAEHFFGVADITGAYFAGIIISNTKHSEYVNRRFEIVSYLLLSPIFFANIGISATVEGMNSTIVLFTVILLAVAVLSKVVGCGLGAKLCGFSKKESLQIGVGMISRGEVALIVANKGAAIGLMQPIFFAPIILVVIVTTVITPILLKLVYADSKTQEPLQFSA